MTEATDLITVNGERLWQSLAELAKIGAYVDERTGLTGVNRQTLTDEEAHGRRLVMSWMEEAGLELRIDQVGNVWGRREGTDRDAAPVVMGSHIDSVATAGMFDGCLGVLGGIEVIRTLNERGITTQRPIEVAFFTDEEGARFGVDMLGSSVVAGRIDLQDALALTARDGSTLAGELERHGFNGPVSTTLEQIPHAYVECHIEQGPVLAAEGLELGVVTGVQGIYWQEITILGRAAHAGTTPTQLRIDAGLAASMAVVRLREMAESGKYGSMRSTVGRMEFAPGLTNIVPNRAVFTVDMRNPDDEAMARADADFAAFLAELEERWPGLSITRRQLAKTVHVPFDPEIQKAITQTIEDFGYSHMSLLSGAGHDAQEMALICPVAMIFIPGEYDGISHNPREYSTPEACTRGISALATTVARLAG